MRGGCSSRSCAQTVRHNFWYYWALQRRTEDGTQRSQYHSTGAVRLCGRRPTAPSFPPPTSSRRDTHVWKKRVGDLDHLRAAEGRRRPRLRLLLVTASDLYMYIYIYIHAYDLLRLRLLLSIRLSIYIYIYIPTTHPTHNILRN